MNLITPVRFLEPGQCLKCTSATLVLLEREVNAVFLSKEGVPLQTDNILYDSFIECLTCGERFEMDRAGFIISPTTEQLKRLKTASIPYRVEENPLVKS